MKHLFTILLTASLAFLLVNCGGGTPPKPGSVSAGGPSSPSYSDHADEGDEMEIAEPSLAAGITAVKVYIENSASMDGYVNGSTHFKNMLYHYLNEVESSVADGALELNYINSVVIPYSADLSSFIKTLSAADFKKRGGKRGSSDIAKVWNTVVDANGPSEISILVSDFIISPGKQSAATVLLSQQTELKKATASYFGTCGKAAVMVYQLMSDFHGTYYDAADKPAQFRDINRPYYVFVIGSQANLAKYREQIGMEDAFRISTDPSYHVENMAILQSGLGQCNYKVKPSASTTVDMKDSHKLRVEKNQMSGSVLVEINVNLPMMLVDANYVMDPANYTTNDVDYRVTSVTKCPAANYTHTIRVEAPFVKPMANLSIGLLQQLPAWVEASNDIDGHIDSADAYNAGLTYGIFNVVSGLNDAFLKNVQQVKGQNCLTVFNLKINQ